MPTKVSQPLLLLLKGKMEHRNSFPLKSFRALFLRPCSFLSPSLMRNEGQRAKNHFFLFSCSTKRENQLLNSPIFPRRRGRQKKKNLPASFYFPDLIGLYLPLKKERFSANSKKKREKPCLTSLKGAEVRHRGPLKTASSKNKKKLFGSFCPKTRAFFFGGGEKALLPFAWTINQGSAAAMERRRKGKENPSSFPPPPPPLPMNTKSPNWPRLSSPVKQFSCWYHQGRERERGILLTREFHKLPLLVSLSQQEREISN